MRYYCPNTAYSNISMKVHNCSLSNIQLFCISGISRYREPGRLGRRQPVSPSQGHSELLSQDREEDRRVRLQDKYV